MHLKRNTVVCGFIALALVVGCKQRSRNENQGARTKSDPSGASAKVFPKGKKLDMEGLVMIMCGHPARGGLVLTRERVLSWWPKASKLPNFVPFENLPLTENAMWQIESFAGSGQFACFAVDPKAGLADLIALVEPSSVEKEICGTFFGPTGSAGGFKLKEELEESSPTVGEVDGFAPIDVKEGARYCFLRQDYVSSGVLKDLETQYNNANPGQSGFNVEVKIRNMDGRMEDEILEPTDIPLP